MATAITAWNRMLGGIKLQSEKRGMEMKVQKPVVIYHKEYHLLKSLAAFILPKSTFSRHSISVTTSGHASMKITSP